MFPQREASFAATGLALGGGDDDDDDDINLRPGAW
jgi:hypothetical protein